MSDSHDHRNDFQRRIGVGERQVGFRHLGTSRTETVRREDNGKVGGQYTHHWDGRVDATVFAETAHIKGKPQEANA